ncbi:MAG TPA: asparagine synthase (glutamine-hydrolyzing) [Gemmatimonadales bacterium]|nr:asparagine synthase (glutamine-hydrolyzing) [Gemmatimonadales bacterium]
MCGITGALGRVASTDVTLRLERLNGALIHRGPDGCGMRYFNNRSAGFGHRRLSILDLETGDQPMSNENGSVWVTYNGEIYNHGELRQELEQSGHRFRTRSDTEVLVHGWEQWGTALFGKLNGIFAFALYDGNTAPGTVWLARDPLGVKPLYLGRTPSEWWFVSELSAARNAGLLEPELRSEAFAEFLVYRFVPSPGTFYQNAWKLPPSHYCRLPLDQLSGAPAFVRYQPEFAPSQLPDTRAEWEEAIRQGLRVAVTRQLMSDVPVGSLLSGGVDSTVVTGLMKEGLPSPPRAFGIGIDGAGPLDELPRARSAAQALQVPLTEVSVTAAEFLMAWPAQVMAMGEPIANSGTLMLEQLCRTVHRTHKVVLSGQGADEPLGGYPRHAGERWYPWMRRSGPLLGLVPERWARSDRVKRVRRLAAQPDQARRFAEILAVFSPALASQMSRTSGDPDALVNPVRQWLPPDSDGDSVNSLLAVDARLSLADDLLLVADHMAMSHSVELRVPFLDLELFALLERMPSRFKISPMGERKWLYRRAVTPLLPPALQSSMGGIGGGMGRKLGFTTPVDEWLSRWATREAEPYLLGPESLLPEYLRPELLRPVLTEVNQGQPRERQLLSLYVLETWLRAATGATH